mgnify:CR=1 FL=1
MEEIDDKIKPVEQDHRNATYANKIKKIEAAIGVVASNLFNGFTNLKLSKLVGRWIAALPSRPVHNTVQVYQSTKTTKVIRLHSLK